MSSAAYQHIINSLSIRGHTSTLPTIVDQTVPRVSTMNLSSTNVTEPFSCPPRLVEVNQIKLIRKRSFLHWPYQTSPSKGEMIHAGFFNCDIGDRVICLYCNRICQQWTPHTIGPMEIHRELSPKCPYVTAMLQQQQTVGAFSTNENIGNTNVGDAYQPEVPEGTIFASMSWIPHGRYANKLCTNELYQRVRESRFKPRESATFSDGAILSQSVVDRLDLPISRYLIETKGFDPFIIASCYENQLRQNDDDFANDCHLQMACTLLDKQINYINGNENNIIIVNDR